MSTRATRAERAEPLPGDELVPAAAWQATRAITIAAPPESVWPWIVQMGHPTHRAGWYAPYWFDRVVWRIRVRSSDVLRPELQDLAVGDRVPDSPDDSVGFTAARVEPPRVLVLHSTQHVLPPYEDLSFAWIFVLRPVASGTRLLLRARTSFRPVWPRLAVRAFVAVVMNLGDVIEAGGILRGVRRRAEAPG